MGHSLDSGQAMRNEKHCAALSCFVKGILHCSFALCIQCTCNGHTQLSQKLSDAQVGYDADPNSKPCNYGAKGMVLLSRSIFQSKSSSCADNQNWSSSIETPVRAGRLLHTVIEQNAMRKLLLAKAHPVVCMGLVLQLQRSATQQCC